MVIKLSKFYMDLCALKQENQNLIAEIKIFGFCEVSKLVWKLES